MKKVCILVVSHNNPDLTDRLCESIISTTKNVDYDLHVIETGSNLAKVSKYMTLWVKEGIRMTRGFNFLKKYADYVASFNNVEYDAYQLFVNDAVFIDKKDLVSTLYAQMMERSDCAIINPYHSNTYRPHLRQGRVEQSGARAESFSDIICPMIRASFWNSHPDLNDDIFFYGWGTAYDFSHIVHTNKMKIYISDEVGIFHESFTSYLNKEQTEEKMEVDQFVKTARDNMHQGLVSKYGENWKEIIYNSVPDDVSTECLFRWLKQHDGFIKHKNI